VFVFVYNFPHINMHMGLCLLHASTEHPFGFPPLVFPPAVCVRLWVCVCMSNYVCFMFVYSILFSLDV